MSRDIERGAAGIRFLLNFMLFNILPTLLEIGFVAGILFVKYDPWFGIVTLATLVVYVIFTLWVTEWRMIFRRTMNEMDSRPIRARLTACSTTRPSNTLATRATRQGATTKR